MSKWLGKASYLSDTAEEVKTKIKLAVTDKNRIGITDKGNEDISTVGKYHEAFNEYIQGNCGLKSIKAMASYLI